MMISTASQTHTKLTAACIIITKRAFPKQMQSSDRSVCAAVLTLGKCSFDIVTTEFKDLTYGTAVTVGEDGVRAKARYF